MERRNQLVAIKQCASTVTSDGLYVTSLHFIQDALAYTKSESSTGVVRLDYIDRERDISWVVFNRGPCWSWDHMRHIVFKGVNDCENLLKEVEDLVGVVFADPSHGLIGPEGEIAFVDNMSNDLIGYGLNGRLDKILPSSVKISTVRALKRIGGLIQVEYLDEKGELSIGTF